MKKVFACIVVISLFVNTCVSAQTNLKMEKGTDVQTAIGYGLVPKALQTYDVMDNTITYKQFCTMLKRIVNAKDANKLEQWDNIAQNAMTSSKEIKREDAMISVYETAVVLDCGTRANGAWYAIDNDLANKDLSQYLTNDYPEWENAKNIAPYQSFIGDTPSLTYIQAAFYYARDQYSLKTRKTIFEKAPSELDMKANLTIREAIGVVLHFYESICSSVDANTYSDAMDAFSASKGAILGTESSIKKGSELIPGSTYTGTEYYVSASEGNDDNDGLSANKPWKTLYRVHCQAYSSNEPLTSGDIVLFKRGEIWRNETLDCVEGVTYSAYGTGEKPRFYGSPESGVGEDKWTLAYEKDGMKIWKFYKDITDTGGIIFNDGESYANRLYGWWAGDEKKYVDFSDATNSFSEQTSLVKDLDFCCMIDYTGCEFPIHRYLLNKSGPLYLRCDKGNPGKLYDEIEFETTDAPNDWKPIFRCKSKCTIDNLSILYWGDTAIASRDNRMKNICIQNCEVGWGGNCVLNYNSATPSYNGMLAGDGIYGICNDSVVKNNYCHNIDGSAVRVEYCEYDNGDSDIEYGTVDIMDNIIEKSGQGITFEDWLFHMKFNEINITNNKVYHTGEGYCHGCFCPFVAISLGHIPAKATSICVRNNVSFGSTSMLYGGYLSDNTIYEGNQFVYKIDDAQCLHDWNEPTYVWTEDNSSCTATTICNDDPSHVITEKKAAIETITKEATYENTGIKTYTVKFDYAGFTPQTKDIVIEKKVKPIPIPVGVKIGSVYTINMLKYKVTGTGTVSLVGTTKKKSDVKFKSLFVGAKVKIEGKYFLITSIGDNAFKQYKRLAMVTLGTNIKIIEKNAFYLCSRLKNVKVKSTKISRIGKNAIKSISKKAVIDVPNNKIKAYRKLLKKNTGFRKTMKIK